MRKSLAIVFMALVGLSLMAAPAVAQRDPFEPQGGTDEGVVEPEEGATEPGEGESEPEAEPPPEGGLGDTGIDSQPWLVLAYSLIATGAGIVAIGRVLHSSP